MAYGSLSTAMPVQYQPCQPCHSWVYGPGLLHVQGREWLVVLCVKFASLQLPSSFTPLREDFALLPTTEHSQIHRSGGSASAQAPNPTNTFLLFMVIAPIVVAHLTKGVKVKLTPNLALQYHNS
jgi:hypothetical protein